MFYQSTQFQDIIEIMASCDRLGLMYVVQKDIKVTDKWFGRKDSHVVWSLQVIQYVDTVEESEEHETKEQSEGQGEPETNF